MCAEDATIVLNGRKTFFTNVYPIDLDPQNTLIPKNIHYL